MLYPYMLLPEDGQRKNSFLTPKRGGEEVGRRDVRTNQQNVTAVDSICSAITMVLFLFMFTAIPLHFLR